MDIHHSFHVLPVMQFELHIPPNRSALEPYREQITAMRAQNWPHLKIARWLSDNHQITIHQESVRRFCISRSIHKLTLKNAPKIQSKTKTAPKQSKLAEKEKFIYEPSLIDIHSSSKH